MFCSKCGNEIMDEAVICVKCGCYTHNNQPAVTNTKASSNTNSVSGKITAYDAFDFGL